MVILVDPVLLQEETYTKYRWDFADEILYTKRQSTHKLDNRQFLNCSSYSQEKAILLLYSSTKFNKSVPLLKSFLNLPYIKNHVWRGTGFICFVVVKEDFSAAYNHILK